MHDLLHEKNSGNNVPIHVAYVTTLTCVYPKGLFSLLVAKMATCVKVVRKIRYMPETAE